MARFQKIELEEQKGSDTAESTSPAPESGVSPWIERAEQSRRMGLSESALQYYSRALEEDRSLIACWVGQVRMLVLLGEYPEAELWSRKALELFPSDPELLAARGQALCRLKKKRESYGAVDLSMQQPGESAFRWMVRGELLVSDRQSMDKHCFDKSLQADRDWMVPVDIALIYRHYAQPGNAMSRARLAVERDGSAPYAWFVLASCQADLGMATAANRSLEVCLDLKPDYREADELRHSLDTELPWWKRIRSLWSR